MAIQNTYSFTAPASAKAVESAGARAPSRKGGGGIVGGVSPFANMMAQEHAAKVDGMQLGAQSALSTGLGGMAEKLGGMATGSMAGKTAMGGGSAREQALASLAQGGKSGGSEIRASVQAPASREDIARANNYAQAKTDMQRTSALDTIAQGMSAGDGLLDSARNAVTMRNLRSVVGGFNLKAPVMPMADSIKSHAIQGAYRANGGGRHAGKGAQLGSASGIGGLAAQFESGKEGIAAVGYDRHGGTSYGKFQIASRV
ncbi:MAG: hypothetical protein RRY29_09090, partial [Desulfovibrionaceae bacterium]